MNIGISDALNETNLMIIEYGFHFQAVDAFKGINYLYCKGNSIRLRVQQKERTYPIFCLLSPKEQQVWQKDFYKLEAKSNSGTNLITTTSTSFKIAASQSRPITKSLQILDERTITYIYSKGVNLSNPNEYQDEI